MNPRSGSLSETLLDRLDEWNKTGKWLPDADQWFPRSAFVGIFAWNLPILVAAIGLIGTLMYRADQDPSGIGFFTPLNWPVELAIGTACLATTVDVVGCLWIRYVWNRRARWLRKRHAQEKSG